MGVYINEIKLYTVNPRCLRVYNEYCSKRRSTGKHLERYTDLNMWVAQRKFSAMINNGRTIQIKHNVAKVEYGIYEFKIDTVSDEIFFIGFSGRNRLNRDIIKDTHIKYEQLGLKSNGREYNMPKYEEDEELSLIS